MSDQPINGNQPVEDKFQTLLNNAQAAQVISRAVEGTIGPKGLDIMMVDRLGNIVITNDGVTILKLMEVNHPAGQLIAHSARAQQEQVGDGTTTTTIIAGALVAEGTAQIMKGVPVTRVIEGIHLGVKASLEMIRQVTVPVESLADKQLYSIARVAGRGNDDLAKLVMKAVQFLEPDKFFDPDFKFSDTLVSRDGVENQVFGGVLVNKLPVNRAMPFELEGATILVVDDALAPAEVSQDTMKTETGFKHYLKARQVYEHSLQRICTLGVNLIVLDRGIDDLAEEIFTDAGIMVLQRVSSQEIDRLCQHTGARKIKRNSINREPEALKPYLGHAGLVQVDEKLGGTIVSEGAGEKQVTIIVGASTEEVVDERERMARDAAAAVQAALQAGTVPGGGALEAWIGVQLEDLVRQQQGMAAYGILSVKEALFRPFMCMASNCGFNPLEKLREVTALQRKNHNPAISFDAETGHILDMKNAGVIDPAMVKIHAIKTAGEVAVAILRINTVIRMRSKPDDKV